MAEAMVASTNLFLIENEDKLTVEIMLQTKLHNLIRRGRETCKYIFFPLLPRSESTEPVQNDNVGLYESKQ